MNDSDYGSSQYRQFPTISSRLKVDAGTNKPARVKQKDTTFNPQGPGVIKRGSREGTLWVKGKTTSNVIPSNPIDEDSQSFFNPDGDDSPII